MNTPTLPTLPDVAPDARATPLPRPRRGQGGAHLGQGSLPTEKGKVRHHALYRFWDATHTLLYIGITVHLPTRIAEHRGEKEWWTEVASITVEHFDTREESLTAERDAIKTEHPVWNVVHNATPGTVRPPAANPEHMPDMCQERCADDLGEFATYYPFAWSHSGIAQYECRHGHRWACWWATAVDSTGWAPKWRRNPVSLLETTR